MSIRPALRTSRSGVSILVDTSSLRRLSKDLRKASKTTQKEFRTKWRSAAQLVADDAKQRASWSTKIPGTIKVRGNGVNLAVIAGGPKAPGAAALENSGRTGTFKHPVFERRSDWVDKSGRKHDAQIRYTTRSNRRLIANRKASAAPWVEQAARPFLAPAMAARMNEITEIMGEAMESAVNDALGDLNG